MNENDLRQEKESLMMWARHANERWIAENIIKRLKCIDRLDKQLAAVKEAGEPFEELDRAVHSNEWVIEKSSPWYGISLVNLQDTSQTISIADPEIHALAQALDGINPSTTKCRWVCDGDGVYETACGEAWEITTGNLSDNKMKFCPYCGGQIEEIEE